MAGPEFTPLPSPKFTTLSDYEDWAGRYWVHQPGTLEAQQHSRMKFEEEVRELMDAVASGNPDDIVSEAGDVLWTASATGSNAGITLSEGIGTAFPAYFPADEPIKLEDIDPLAKSLFDGIGKREIEEYLRDSDRVLGKAAKQWFLFKDGINHPPKTFADAWVTLERVDVVNTVTLLTVLSSFLAQNYAGKGLKDVLEANYQKIEGRVQSGAPVTTLPL